MEGSVMKGLRDFRGSPRDSLTGRTSSCEKHLDKFFKIFVLSVLAIGPGDLLATWLSCENHVFCAYRSVFNVFSFPSNISDCSLSSPFQTSLKLTVSLSKNLHFYITSTSIFTKKVWFSYYLIALHVYCMCFLDFCVVVWVLWHLSFMYGMGLFYWVG